MGRAKFFHLSTGQLREASARLQEQAVFIGVTPAVRAEAIRLGVRPEQLKSAIVRYRLSRRQAEVHGWWRSRG